MSNSDLKHFRLITLDEVMRLPHQPAVFVLCFDCDGLLVKVSYSRYPRQRIMAFFQQAAPCREIWLFDVPSSRLPEAMCRHLRDLFEDHHVRAGYINVPMAKIDAAVGDFLAKYNTSYGEAVQAAA